MTWHFAPFVGTLSSQSCFDQGLPGQRGSFNILIDLHTHSSISDGSDSPARLVELAAAAGCTTLALTDHDTTDGISEARDRGIELGVEVIAGIELSCHTPRRTIHLLGFLPHFDDALLQSRLRTQRELRGQRNERLLLRLNDIGLAITADDVARHGRGSSVGRPHFAAALMERGYVSSIDEAFRRFLSDGSKGHVERRGLPAAEGIEWIREAGGVAVWAHPYTPVKFGGSDLQPDLDQLIEAGLGGLECWYGRYDQKVRRRLARIAEQRGLIATGGSDYHGSYKPDLFIGSGTGNLDVPESALTDLQALLHS